MQRPTAERSLPPKGDRGCAVVLSPVVALMVALLPLILSGCGINKSRLATEQLVVSEAVDKAVATIDFSALSGKKVYFDTQYLDGVNMGPNGNVKYVISSLRQQMMAYDLRLQEKAEAADFIVEGRVGVLANDGYEVTYGIPGNAAAASASVLLPTPVPIPAPGMPELSLGRRNHQAGTAKVGLFAYDRVTREPVWQAGVKRGASDVRDTWVLGLGPYQSRRRPRRSSRANREAAHGANINADPLAAYNSATLFERAVRPSTSTVAAASQPAAGGANQASSSAQSPSTSPVDQATATGNSAKFNP